MAATKRLGSKINGEEKDYPVSTKVIKGFGIVVNNVNFDGGVVRRGAETDETRLSKTLSNIGLNVISVKDNSAQEMDVLMRGVAANSDLADHDYLVVVIITHGKGGKLMGIDGNHFEVYQLLDIFSTANCPGLKGKPKLFFLQGDKLDIGIDKATGHITKPGGGLAAFADVIISYPSFPGCYPFRSESEGSAYIEYLCSSIDGGSPSNDLMDVLLRVTQKLEADTIKFEGKDIKQTHSLDVMGFSKKLFLKRAPIGTQPAFATPTLKDKILKRAQSASQPVPERIPLVRALVIPEICHLREPLLEQQTAGHLKSDKVLNAISLLKLNPKNLALVVVVAEAVHPLIKADTSILVATNDDSLSLQVSLVLAQMVPELGTVVDKTVTDDVTALQEMQNECKPYAKQPQILQTEEAFKKGPFDLIVVNGFSGKSEDELQGLHNVLKKGGQIVLLKSAVIEQKQSLDTEIFWKKESREGTDVMWRQKVVTNSLRRQNVLSNEGAFETLMVTDFTQVSEVKTLVGQESHILIGGLWVSIKQPIVMPSSVETLANFERCAALLNRCASLVKKEYKILDLTQEFHLYFTFCVAQLVGSKGSVVSSIDQSFKKLCLEKLPIYADLLKEGRLKCAPEVAKGKRGHVFRLLGPYNLVLFDDMEQLIDFGTDDITKLLETEGKVICLTPEFKLLKKSWNGALHEVSPD